MNDFFELQQTYLNIANSRIAEFCLDVEKYIEEIQKNFALESKGNNEFDVYLKKTNLIEREIKISRDFGCITNELRSILDSAVVALSRSHGMPNTSANKLCYKVVRGEESEKKYREFLENRNVPEGLIAILLHIQPKNGYVIFENKDENILDLLDEVNNENKHRQHLPLVYPKINIDKTSIYHNNEFIADVIPIDGGEIGFSPFLKIIAAEGVEIDVNSFDFKFSDIFLKSDNARFSNIAARPFLVKASGAVACCVEIMRLYKNPSKLDFFGIPLIREK